MKNRQIYVEGGIIGKSKEGEPGGVPPLQWSNNRLAPPPLRLARPPLGNTGSANGN